MLRIERLSKEVQQVGKHCLEKQATCKSELDIALRWLQEKPSPIKLREQINQLENPGINGVTVVPCTEKAFTTTQKTITARPDSVVAIGVDGSQIFPDRHAALQYYLIQTGALIYRYDGSLPEPKTQEWLNYRDEALYDENGYLISNDAVSRKRSVLEMHFTSELSTAERVIHPQSPTFILMDGPLLWPYAGEADSAQEDFHSYLSALTSICQNNVVPVGYIERPGGRHFIRMLWLNQLPKKAVYNTSKQCPIHLLTDIQLMESILPYGHRTTWYKRQSPTQNEQAAVGLEIWFSYLNVGSEKQPNIVRIEVPRNFTDNASLVDIIITTVLHQSKVLNGYPYILARAHEMALVTSKDKAALDAYIQRSLLEQGLVRQISEKARQKSYLGNR